MEKKNYKKGFVLGKFMPPHAGHLHLISSAKKHVDELTILVCTLKREAIAGEIRFEWMKALFPDENVIHVTDEVPAYPHEHPDFEKIWTALLKQKLGETEIFFSSEKYGEDVARWLNITHICIDEERKEFPVSGTAIRTQPAKYWDFIPANVKPFFTKRIVLTGPESTGKTSMAKKLAEHFDTKWIPEYGRDFFASVNGKLIPEHITEIAKGQMKLEDKAMDEPAKILFCDTDLIVTKIWGEIYFKNSPAWLEDEIEKRKYNLWLLMDIDVPWINDGTREFPDLRQFHFNRIKEELEKRKLNYIIINGNYEERFSKAVNTIEKLFL